MFEYLKGFCCISTGFISYLGLSMLYEYLCEKKIVNNNKIK